MRYRKAFFLPSLLQYDEKSNGIRRVFLVGNLCLTWKISIRNTVLYLDSNFDFWPQQEKCNYKTSLYVRLDIFVCIGMKYEIIN